MSVNDWPPKNTQPVAGMPYFQDGKYSDSLLQVSPEGNVFGQQRRIHSWAHGMWWDGATWREIEVAGRVMSVGELPSGPRPFGEIWQARQYDAKANAYSWIEHFWDSSAGQWNPVQWLWNVDDISDLPTPGYSIGQAHVVVETGVPMWWTGFQWERERHSTLKDDQPLRHLPDGFLRSLSPDARVVYYSPTEIGIEPVKGGSGKVLVNLEYITARREASVFNNLTVLDWDAGSQSVVARHIEPGAEYWIYLANSDNAFVIDSLPADGTHSATPAWDYRGRLFVSSSPDVNGYLSHAGSGLNARLVGKIETDTTAAADGGPYFLREIDISLISRTVSLPETYREFSDFVLQFDDETTISLVKLDGTYGQIYAGGNLHYLGEGLTLTTADPWIEWSDSDPKLTRKTTALSAETQWFIYLAGDIDPFNFNAINPDTSRPWQATDVGAEGHYSAVLDMRLELFLSTKTPDHGFLDEAWPGYYARHVGQVQTDANGKLVNTWDLSAIRQPTLNPSWFDGLAEIEIRPESSTELRICRRKGSSGIVCVRGAAVQTFDHDHADVHVCATADLIKEYTEGNPGDPLSDLGAISSYPGETLYLYIANHRPLWGNLAGRTFVSDHAPTGGYLSQNWPGNNARWLCSIKPDSDGAFTGAFITAAVAVAAHSQLFDDEPEKHRLIVDDAIAGDSLWSSRQVVAEAQKRAGLPVMLEYLDATHVKLRRAGDQDALIIFPDDTSLTVGSAGVSLQVAGNVGATYYVYLDASGLYLSTSAPDQTFARLHIKGTDSVLVGWIAFSATDTLAGTWNVFSAHNEPDREWDVEITAATTTLSLPGCLVPPNGSAELTRTGQSCGYFYANNSGAGNLNITAVTTIGEAKGRYSAVANDPYAILTATATLSHGVISSGTYDSFTLTHALTYQQRACYNIATSWLSFAGKLLLRRSGQYVV